MEQLWEWHGPAAVLALTLLFTVGVVVLVLWIVLPFAVFWTKPLLRELLEAQRETNRKLDQIRGAFDEVKERMRQQEARNLRDGFF